MRLLTDWLRRAPLTITRTLGAQICHERAKINDGVSNHGSSISYESGRFTYRLSIVRSPPAFFTLQIWGITPAQSPTSGVDIVALYFILARAVTPVWMYRVNRAFFHLQNIAAPSRPPSPTPGRRAFYWMLRGTNYASNLQLIQAASPTYQHPKQKYALKDTAKYLGRWLSRIIHILALLYYAQYRLT